jgi:phage terminase small subunit
VHARGCPRLETHTHSGGHQGSGLTPRQALFVKEYLVDLNGTQAAIRAGYSAHTAAAQAVRLLINVNVKAAVDADAAKQHARLDLTAQKVLTELLGVGYAEVAAKDVRVSDKLRALELLAKHLGLLTEQVDHKHSGRFELVWAEDE